MVQTALDAKIERLQKELKETKAAKGKAERKERNGQLIAGGVLIEQFYKTATPEQLEPLKNVAKLLDERNRQRTVAMFARLDAELAGAKNEGKGES